MTQLGASVSRSFTRIQSMCWPGLQSHLKAWLQKDLFPSSCTWLLAGFNCSSLEPNCQNEALSSSLTADYNLPQFLVTWAFPESSSHSNHENSPETKTLSFYNWNSEMTSPHLCHMLITRSKSLNAAWIQGRGLLSGVVSRSRGHWGPFWRLPSPTRKGVLTINRLLLHMF